MRAFFSVNSCLLRLLEMTNSKCTYIASFYLNRLTALPFLGFGVQCLAQGHYDTRTGRAGDQTTKPAVSGQPALPPGPQQVETTLMRAMRVNQISKDVAVIPKQ